MNFAQQVKREFIFYIRSTRLVEYVIKNNFEPETNKISKYKAEELIANAKIYCEEYIKKSLNDGDITKRQATAGYKALTQVVKNAEKIKEKL